MAEQPRIGPSASRAKLYTAAGGFFLLGAVLSSVSAEVYRDALPTSERSQNGAAWAVAFTCAAAAGVLGIVLLIVRHRLTERYAAALPFLAIVLATVPMLCTRTMTPTGVILMLWPVLFASFLLTEPITWAAIGTGIVGLAAASIVDPRRTLIGYAPMAVTLVLTGSIIVTLQRRVRGLVGELARQASTDPLTGLANRRTLLDTLEREVAEHRRRRASLSLLMIDIDRFKRLNDSAGHDAGDEALRRLAALLRHDTRKGDLAARFGGEEFTALIVDCSLNDAAARADELRARIEADSRGWPHAITVSIGVAELAPDFLGLIADLITNADNALYEAKRRGRNRVEVHEPVD